MNMHLFPFLLEVFKLNRNKKPVYVEYTDSGYTSYDILFEGSKKCPRKLKKRIRKAIKK